MGDPFLRSVMRKKIIHFKVQIEDYSMHVCKGYYTSPEFGDNEQESKWSLLVHAYDGADHENFIDVRLKREDTLNADQYVEAKISIVSCIGINAMKSKKTISFRDTNEARILAVTKEELKGLCGLKRFFYLPFDTLTLQCDLQVVCGNNLHISSYKNEASFLNHTPTESSTSSQYFVHSRFVNEYDYFCWKIHNFSIQTSTGCSIGPEYNSEWGCKWNLVLYHTTDDYYGDCIDVRLVLRESYEKKLIKAKLSFMNSSNNVLLSKEKNVFFPSPGQKQLLSLTDKDTSSLLRLLKKQLIQDDTLILRCEMLLHKEINDSYRSKEDFDNSVDIYSYSPVRLISYLAVIFSLILDFPYSSCLNLLAFIGLFILDTTITIMKFLAVILITYFGFIYAKYKAENIEIAETSLFVVILFAGIAHILYTENRAENNKRKQRNKKLPKDEVIIAYDRYNTYIYDRSNNYYFRKPHNKNRNYLTYY